jgi:hypothetical protein
MIQAARFGNAAHLRRTNIGSRAHGDRGLNAQSMHSFRTNP